MGGEVATAARKRSGVAGVGGGGVGEDYHKSYPARTQASGVVRV